MTDRSVIRFGATDIGFIAEILENVYDLMRATKADDAGLAILEDFISALATDDCIEIVDDEDMLIVED